MLELTKHNTKDIRSFYNNITKEGLVDTLFSQVDKSNLLAQAKIFLTKSKIQEILEADPETLFDLHNEFILSLNKSNTPKEYETYLKVKSLKKPSAEQKKIIRKYDPTVKKLSKIFDYEKYISKKKPVSYKLSNLVGRNTCTYCNRLYTLTVIGNVSIANKSKEITRPQFDHWFPKKKYPLLALSFYNFIPSCSVCNSSVKGEEVFSLLTHIHPYIADKTQKFRFSYIKGTEGKNEVILIFHGDKIKKTLKNLRIQEIYNAHSEYELKDILDLRYKYSDNYLKVLFNDTFKFSEMDKKDAYRLLFGVEIDPNDFHKRPFSKFKYDILKELKLIR
jgi:hypothetical protein